VCVKTLLDGLNSVFRRHDYNGCWLLCGLGVIMTETSIGVIWNTKKLAQEYNMSVISVSMLLKALGATRMSKGNGQIGSKWVYEC